MGTDERLKLNPVKLRAAILMLVFCFLDRNLRLCLSSNAEGFVLMKLREKIKIDPFRVLSNWKGGETNHCSWFGVKCSDGKVVSLNLTDFCLQGTLAPEIGQLKNLKSLILRNNSLSGNVPKEIAELQKIQILDLRYNNFTGPFEFLLNLTFTTILINKDPLQDTSGLQISAFCATWHCTSVSWYAMRDFSIYFLENELKYHQIMSGNKPDHLVPFSVFIFLKFRRDEILFRNDAQFENSAKRRLFQTNDSIFPPGNNDKGARATPPAPSLSAPSATENASPVPTSPLAPPPQSSRHSFPAQTPSPFRTFESIEPPPSDTTSEPPINDSTLPPPVTPPSTSGGKEKGHRHLVSILVGVFGGVLVVSAVIAGLIFFQYQKVAIKPWSTGISGQLQKAFITGVPKLKLSELQASCEDFSNIVGSFQDGTIYKGTLSSGVEIAVTSTAIRSRHEWSTNLETQFAQKIDMLSKVNHRNFLNLIGYCQEDEPFARMLVFEYAPNGTLFEHLNVQEAEHLDWKMRLRIAMGMAYCLDHMHQLNPPISHQNLQSSLVYLTEDNAAKIADFSFPNHIALPTEEGSSSTTELIASNPVNPASNVYSFGVILLEMLTGKMRDTDYTTDLYQETWLVRETADPTLRWVQEDVFERMMEVVQDCVAPDPCQRPTMRQVVAKMKEITGIPPDEAIPRLSPAWWAELEIISTEGI